MHQPVRVLVVDDNPQMVEVFGFLLRSEGYEVIEAKNAERGLALAREQCPDVILLDVVLPDGDGFDVCKQLKADPSLIGTFVVLASGRVTTSADKTVGLEAGADDYIARPILMPEFLARFQRIVRIQQAEKRLREAEERWQSLVQNAEGYVFTLTPVGQIQFANRVPPGWPAPPLEGKSLLDLATHHHRETLEQQLRAVVATARPASFEACWGPASSPSARWACRLSPILRGNRVEGLVLTAADITTRGPRLGTATLGSTEGSHPLQA